MGARFTFQKSTFRFVLPASFELEKGVEHKYIRRYKKGGRWRYVYPKKGKGDRHSGSHHVASHHVEVKNDHLHKGASFALGKGRGHLVIESIQGGRVTYYNDDPKGDGKRGASKTSSIEAFKLVVEGVHKDAAERHAKEGHAWRKDLLARAKEQGSGGHIGRAEKELSRWEEKHGKHLDLPEPTPEPTGDAPPEGTEAPPSKEKPKGTYPPKPDKPIPAPGSKASPLAAKSEGEMAIGKAKREAEAKKKVTAREEAHSALLNHGNKALEGHSPARSEHLRTLDVEDRDNHLMRGHSHYADHHALSEGSVPLKEHAEGIHRLHNTAARSYAKAHVALDGHNEALRKAKPPTKALRVDLKQKSEKSGDKLKRHMKRFASKDGNRYYLGRAETVQGVTYSVDGHRLVGVRTGLPDGPMDLGNGVEGDFPSVDMVIPKVSGPDRHHTMSVSTLKELVGAGKSLATISPVNSTGSVSFRVKDGQIQAIGSNGRSSSALATGKAHGNARDQRDATYDARYLADALSGLKASDHVRIQMPENHLSPLRIDRGDGEFHVLMPIRHDHSDSSFTASGTMHDDHRANVAELKQRLEAHNAEKADYKSRTQKGKATVAHSGGFDEVKGVSGGGLLLHKRGDGWIITHEASGLRLGQGMGYRAFAERMHHQHLKSGVDWTQSMEELTKDPHAIAMHRWHNDVVADESSQYEPPKRS